MSGVEFGNLDNNGNNDPTEIDYAQTLVTRNWTNGTGQFRWGTTGGVTDGDMGGGGYDYINPTTYQFTSQTIIKMNGRKVIKNGGTVADFLRTDGSSWANDFAGLKPGSAEFSAIWRKLALTAPDELHSAEYAYTKRTHYDPAVRRIELATGLDIDEMPDAVRNALWSTAVQHGYGSANKMPGGATRIFVDAIRQTDGALSRGDGEYSQALIHNVYTRRMDYWPQDFARYQSEMKRALRSF